MTAQVAIDAESIKVSGGRIILRCGRGAGVKAFVAFVISAIEWCGVTDSPLLLAVANLETSNRFTPVIVPERVDGVADNERAARPFANSDMP
jgi:hypothetical protein